MLFFRTVLVLDMSIFHASAEYSFKNKLLLVFWEGRGVVLMTCSIFVGASYGGLALFEVDRQLSASGIESPANNTLN